MFEILEAWRAVVGTRLRRWLRRDEGIEAVEYAMMFGVAAIIIVILIVFFRTAIADLLARAFAYVTKAFGF